MAEIRRPRTTPFEIPGEKTIDLNGNYTRHGFTVDPNCKQTRNACGYYCEMPQLPRTGQTGSRRRRRGEVLERALYEATLGELAEVGYGGLTMQGIAARAQTGKAALYRRYYSKCGLVHCALDFALPPLPKLRPGRSARANLLTVFKGHRDLLAGKTAFPGAEIIGQLVHHPELRAIFADSVVGPRLEMVESILRAAVEGGEMESAAMTPFTARVGSALISQHFVLTGVPPNRRELELIVDTVIPPRPQPTPTRATGG
jgi:AcrR family transcriptional regulator